MIWVQLGHALKEAGRNSAADAAYRQALALDATDADLLLSLGHLHKLMARPDSAIDFYQRSAAIDGNQPARDELRRLGAERHAPSFDRSGVYWSDPLPQKRPPEVPNPTTWALPAPPVRAIAYYLPQFHPFAENDRWWGRGFTEWTNVANATPQFAGHYQPHQPGELGYYDLRVAEVQRRQAALASLYGVSGFCFYFYWFSGAVLMERPIRSFADDQRIKLPFCLCWANENWTRRWDGLDSDVLISQNYSAVDDMEFIKYVSEYLSRERYIRIDGKPLLIVYRAELLPDPGATVGRWRTYCRANGIGELFLACTQSFEKTDPTSFGFDAAIEFPPNGMNARSFSSDSIVFREGFRGALLDYEDAVAKGELPPSVAYPLIRAVFGGWDNTPRRNSGSTAFPNATPRLYRRYLESVCDQVIEGGASPVEERLVFINAWNEWAEGAHLEPDQRHGYGYLEATRMALIRAGAKDDAIRQARFGGATRRPRLAVIVHAHHPKILAELVPLFHDYPCHTEFFFTTSSERSDEIATALSDLAHSYSIIVTENRGRDVLPFLKVLAQMWHRRFEYVLKLHTKQSEHRDDGPVWRSEIVQTIATPDHLAAILDALDARPDAGIVGVASHLLPMHAYWGSNAGRVRDLASRLGVSEAETLGARFLAGTMFVARLEALEPLMGLSLSDEDFEPESGQRDGTLAHAIERAISLSASAASLKVLGVIGDGRGIEFAEEGAEHSFPFATRDAPQANG